MKIYRFSKLSKEQHPTTLDFQVFAFLFYMINVSLLQRLFLERFNDQYLRNSYWFTTDAESTDNARITFYNDVMFGGEQT